MRVLYFEKYLTITSPQSIVLIFFYSEIYKIIKVISSKMIIKVRTLKLMVNYDLLHEGYI